MKTTNIDNLGRIVIPSSYRKLMNLSQKKEVTLSFQDGKVIIQSSNGLCRLCGGSLDKSNDLSVCSLCIEKIKMM